MLTPGVNAHPSLPNIPHPPPPDSPTHTRAQGESVLLYGAAEGGALAHRFLIESSDRRVGGAVIEGALLTQRQYAGGRFYAAGAARAYDVAVDVPDATATTRAILLLIGAADARVPYLGGASNGDASGAGGGGGDGDGERYHSVYASVQAYVDAKHVAATYSAATSPPLERLTALQVM